MKTVTQMTLNLPTALINATEELVKEGRAKNIDDFVISAMYHELLKVQQLSKNSQDSLENSDILNDPIWGLGENPVVGNVMDASENVDKYLYS